MKKIVTLSFAVFGIVFLSGCGQQPLNQTQPKTPASEASLSKTFTDSFVGYKIKYPDSWIILENKTMDITDSNGGKVSDLIISSGTDESSPVVFIKAMDSGQSGPITSEGKSFNNLTADEVINGIKANLESESKVYDEGDFIYKFTDGTIITGKQLKQESSDDGTTIKEWIVIVANETKIFEFTFHSNSLDQYDIHSKIANSMLNSWKITK